MNHHADDSMSAGEALEIFNRVAGSMQAQRPQSATHSAQGDEPEEFYEQAALAVATRAIAALQMAAPRTQQQARPAAAKAAPAAGHSAGGSDPIAVLMARTGAPAEMEPAFRANVARLKEKFTGWEGLPTGHTPLTWALSMTHSTWVNRPHQLERGVA